MSAHRHRARAILIGLGILPHAGFVRTLAAELKLNEDRLLDIIGRRLGPNCRDIISGELAKPPSILPEDGVAQTAEDVADQHGAAAPAGRP